ncbi:MULTISPECIES: hypothetical protein [Thermococcus]|jgi:hypothetical protein|uniref:Uncharacterized protein n=1 Tax=Thermococcus barossii TaxID=54077 RepID=A0A2Z2MLR1_9EURY|nr:MULTISPECIES: hypothetical protein [Thermococcus]ASJ05685.1 hypothetical protein A3L01_10045 [Thermococcus barossii]NJE76840.1 hypothetical protein [Thermococcus sp. ES12]
MGRGVLAFILTFSFIFNVFLGKSGLSLGLLVPLLVYWFYLTVTGRRPELPILLRDFGLIFLIGTAGWLLGVAV